MNDNQRPIEFVEMPPEMAALLQRQHEIDRAEAGPKLPIPSFDYRGVTIESRWSVAAECDRMRAFVDMLPDLARARIESIWCDSSACADYIVRIGPGRWMEGIEWDVRDAILRSGEGFNGLTVEGDDRSARFDPIWLGDDEEFQESAE
ncbi:MAG: hypothetical protein JWQ16_1045 [Novosphingobium sp.]|nr:hypothetical protein [Novosphingobium sp.]